MNGFLDFFIKCFLPFMISIIVIACVIDYRSNKTKKYKEKCEKYLLSKDNELFKYINDMVHNIDKTLIGSTVEMSFFDLFKDQIIDGIFNKVNKKIKNEGVDWAFKNSKIDNKYIKEYGSFACIESASNILHSEYITFILADIFVSTIKQNNYNAEKIEKEAIEYHNQFGKDDDIKLHPADTKTDTSDASENYQTSLDDLVSTGTVEMIEDD